MLSYYQIMPRYVTLSKNFQLTLLVQRFKYIMRTGWKSKESLPLTTITINANDRKTSKCLVYSTFEPYLFSTRKLQSVHDIISKTLLMCSRSSSVSSFCKCKLILVHTNVQMKLKYRTVLLSFHVRVLKTKEVKRNMKNVSIEYFGSLLHVYVYEPNSISYSTERL